MSLVFYASTGEESIYSGKFAGKLAHVFQNIFSLNNLIYIVIIVLNIPYFLLHMRIFSYVMIALVFYQCPIFAWTPMVLSSLYYFCSNTSYWWVYTWFHILNAMYDLLYSTEFVWATLHVGCDQHIFSLSMTHECHHMKISYFRTPMVLSSLLLL